MRFCPQWFQPGGWIDKETTTQMMSDVEAARDYLDWWSAGKNIFLFSEDLVQAFLRTDVEDVPTKLFQSPYRVMYFKFGHRTQIQTLFDPVRFLDGAYISAYHGGLTVNYTSVRKTPLRAVPEPVSSSISATAKTSATPWNEA